MSVYESVPGYQRLARLTNLSLDIDFSSRDTSTERVNQLVTFAEKTGLLTLLSSVTQPQDYLLGVEVGLDSNARKNRSGVILESLVETIIDSLAKAHPSMCCLKQATFEQAAEVFGLDCLHSMNERRFDFATFYSGRATNIEVNFYGGTGSKPSEIVNSYADRARILRECGWRFIWVTDGPGWLKMRNPLRNGIEAIDYVLNYQMVKDGFLEAILLQDRLSRPMT